MGLDRRERLEAVEDLFADLRHANGNVPVLVEGPHDVEALRNLGLEGDIVRVNAGQSVIAVVETLGEDHDEVIILTDWDAHGGKLAQRIRESCDACGLRYEGDFRRQLARLVRKEVKDVEGLDTYLRNLRIEIRGVPGASGRHGLSVGR